MNKPLHMIIGPVERKPLSGHRAHIKDLCRGKEWCAVFWRNLNPLEARRLPSPARWTAAQKALSIRSIGMPLNDTTWLPSCDQVFISTRSVLGNRLIEAVGLGVIGGESVRIVRLGGDRQCLLRRVLLRFEALTCLVALHEKAIDDPERASFPRSGIGWQITFGQLGLANNRDLLVGNLDPDSPLPAYVLDVLNTHLEALFFSRACSTCP